MNDNKERCCYHSPEDECACECHKKPIAWQGVIAGNIALLRTDIPGNGIATLFVLSDGDWVNVGLQYRHDGWGWLSIN